ncbi:MAG TPA: hypothetical protein VG122_09005 [Gemmata sp.]|jgi:hypothetical protein|nr:hypothetical protein [Gemmata sp.]
MAKVSRKATKVLETPVTNAQADQQTETAKPEQSGEQVMEQPDPATEFNPAELEGQSQIPGDQASQHPRTEQTHAGGVKQKQWNIPEAFAIETINARDNAVHLYRSDKDRAFLIRMDKNPNDGRAKDDPHPALAAIKGAGFRWSEARADGKMAWGKRWQDGQFHFAEEQEARKLAKKLPRCLDRFSNRNTSPVKHSGLSDQPMNS